MARILIVDDDKGFRKVLQTMVGRLGHETVAVSSKKECLKQVLEHDFDLVLLDVRLPDGSGLEVIPKLKDSVSAPEVIIITGFSDQAGAELALNNGAWDYIQKPIPYQDLNLQLTRVLEYRREKRAARKPNVLKRDNILGESPQMVACLELLAEAASSLANVMITGETGTGKELFARAIHENSPRAKEDFVVVDCTALPENLVESLLFGYKKGAFTGADKSREGLIKQADGGTLFLDEIGELPPAIQSSFLRVIQERRFRPLGARVEESSDFRLIAATNRDLEAMVESGSFREDLLFRLRSLSLSLPPLRERREDIKGLALHYTTRLCERYDWETKGMSADFFCLLGEYSWPGNVRELISVLERAITAAGSAPILIPQHLPTYVRVQTTTSQAASAPPPSPGAEPLRRHDSGAFPTLKAARDSSIAELEAGYMKELMSLTGRNIKEACRLSGLSRTRVYALLKKYDLVEA